MAILDKDAYERKREWAARRMAENAKVESLTDEQHELLEKLCTYRHELHCNWGTMFNPQSGNFNELADVISEYAVGTGEWDLYSAIKEAFGREPFTPTDWPTRECCKEWYAYDDIENAYEDPDEAYEVMCEVLSKVNSEIEAFLAEVDKEHGTSYCPSGITRR